MSLSGVRDISALTMAPEGRQEIETRLGYTDDEDVLREILLREKNRGGQVFFLHNRVSSIVGMAAHLARLAPECSFAIGHGQMGARELQRVMDTFTRGEVDVLVATTIIESGIDIPTAGTIVIHDADQFGLAELHQLRGRVGRGAHKAYCCLLVDRTKPLREEARARLKALEEMNQLGAGFAISMKDLEIRGAGNILGPQQSGHIAAVGYDMYCRILKRAVESLQAGGDLETVLASPPRRPPPSSSSASAHSSPRTGSPTGARASRSTARSPRSAAPRTPRARARCCATGSGGSRRRPRT
jgi:transcription-repair coupling factor (superfamily II helicase)